MYFMRTDRIGTTWRAIALPSVFLAAEGHSQEALKEAPTLSSLALTHPEYPQTYPQPDRAEKFSPFANVAYPNRLAVPCHPAH